MRETETQAPVAGADPRADDPDVTALRAAALGMQTAGLDPFNAVSWRLSALADDLPSLRAAAARGAEGERGVDELAFLRQQADALHRLLPGNGDLVARAHFALSAPRPSAGPAAPLFRCGCGFVAYAEGEAGAHHDATRHILDRVPAARASDEPTPTTGDDWQGPCCECGHTALAHLDFSHTGSCQDCSCSKFVRLAAPAAPEVPRG